MLRWPQVKRMNLGRLVVLAVLRSCSCRWRRSNATEALWKAWRSCGLTRVQLALVSYLSYFPVSEQATRKRQKYRRHGAPRLIRTTIIIVLSKD